MAERVKIGKRDHVLDAGCGVGGSSIFLARNYGCHVTGITLSQRQAAMASWNAKRHGVQHLVRFRKENFTRTAFQDESFDVVWSIESVCHARKKIDFIRESYRILRKGGRIAIADGFIEKGAGRWKENLIRKMIRGWAVPNLSTMEAICEDMRKTGFSSVKRTDETSHILPSSLRLYYASFPALLATKLGEIAHIRNRTQTANVLSAYYQHIALKRGLWKYGIVSAEK